MEELGRKEKGLSGPENRYPCSLLADMDVTEQSKIATHSSSSTVSNSLMGQPIDLSGWLHPSINIKKIKHYIVVLGESLPLVPL